MYRYLSVALALFISFFSAQSSFATTVQFQTSLGNFEVNLYDKLTPETVANFLGYVEAGDYSNTYIHRSIKGFVLQGGGFTLGADDRLEKIPTRPAVKNEPFYSNVKGTISMAKLGGQPNSATSQWFISLSDNSANLDVQNGGFTAFGEVIGDGMDVVKSIESLVRTNLVQGTVRLDDFPLRDLSTQDIVNNVKIVPAEHFVEIEAIVILDADPATADSLSPAENTLLKNAQAPQETQKSSSGGSIHYILLILMFLAFFTKRLCCRD